MGRERDELLYPGSAFLPAASEVAFQPPVAVLIEACALPVAAAEKLTLDS